jgi:hypothetical protein
LNKITYKKNIINGPNANLKNNPVKISENFIPLKLKLNCIPTETNASIKIGLPSFWKISFTTGEIGIFKNFISNPAINAYIGGNCKIFFIISFTDGVDDAKYDAVIIPSVVTAINEPDWSITIPILSDCSPKNIFKNGNPTNEVFANPQVRIKAPIVALLNFNNFPTVNIKMNPAANNI